jgi:4-oxalomesaconate tautomerase
MTQTAIPFLFMRGGSSRGPYFRRADLPEDQDTLAKVLIEVVGAGHPNNIDGIGGGTAVTTKVAMLSKSTEPGVDIDYFFGQVGVSEREVDFGPTCGNILVGVGPAALEMGLVPTTGDVTTLIIRAVNTGAIVQATVQTPGGQVTYSGDTAIDGVFGTAAPVGVSFLGVVGTSCGAMLPTGNTRDVIDGIEVTLMDVAMPMMIARADAFGLTGDETAAELDADTALFARMEAIRLKAGPLMGLGDVTRSVTPKIGLLSAPKAGGTISSRYFMPWETHPTMAVTGSQCIAACALTPGTVADGLAELPGGTPALIAVEHPQGSIEVLVDYTSGPDGTAIKSAGLIRSARLIARGEVLVPSSVLTA